MKFALIVPALNEEQAIAGTLRRCLAARATITGNTPVREMVNFCWGERAGIAIDGSCMRWATRRVTKSCGR